MYESGLGRVKLNVILHWLSGQPGERGPDISPPRRSMLLILDLPMYSTHTSRAPLSWGDYNRQR